ncbi:MAG: hypothetical protein JO265_13330 [Acidimicrobiia bacterium]|nr:hypothetical protein [Acidimicrobiia bacterium]
MAVDKARVEGESRRDLVEYSDWYARFALEQRVQRCTCEWERARSEGTPFTDWPDIDLPGCVQLCYCCAAMPVHASSRWSPFFCDGCRPDVFALNRSVGRCVIPMGRHSMMNGVSGDVPDADDGREELVELVLASMRNVSEMTRCLDAWRVQRVRGHVEACGWETEAPSLWAYCDAVQLPPERRHDIFRGMVSSLLDRAARRSGIPGPDSLGT